MDDAAKNCTPTDKEERGKKIRERNFTNFS